MVVGERLKGVACKYQQWEDVQRRCINRTHSRRSNPIGALSRKLLCTRASPKSVTATHVDGHHLAIEERQLRADDHLQRMSHMECSR
ncbi:hypothetical protein Tcan_13937 [Toxocara canis]|uniref:Uncharacterized protein n=1 Tax=Toxocara canis TaxID=6265 RepID=A0A0B2V527_TOXCA|nr:hypothetical protein Tcan_13937 [Toxocara canis]